MSNKQSNRPAASAPRAYSPAARHFHWLTAALVLIMLPLGFAMTYRAHTLDKFDGLTNAMYSAHKLIGFIILWLVLARFIYRLRNGAPPSEPGLERWQVGASHATHWSLYLLLLVVPLGGWIGVSLYGARDIFGFVSLPAIAPVNQELSEKVFKLHEYGAKAVLLLVGLHVAAALYHHLIRRDGVLTRMWPSLNKSDRNNQA